MLSQWSHSFCRFNERVIWLSKFVAYHPMNGEWSRKTIISQLPSFIFKHEGLKDAISRAAGCRKHLPQLVKEEESSINSQIVIETIRPTASIIDTKHEVIIVDSLANDTDRTYTTTRYCNNGIVCVQANGPIRAYSLSMDDDFHQGIQFPIINLLDDSQRPWPPIFRSFRSNLLPVNAGYGRVTLWDLKTNECVCTFEAIKDSCQGQLVDTTFACFNLQWAPDSSMGRIVNCWNVAAPSKPSLMWNTEHIFHVVDVAVNSFVVAIALGTFVETEDDETRPQSSPDTIDSSTSSPFSVELRNIADGSFLYKIDPLSGIRNILCMNLSRYNLFILRATHDGTKVFVVDLASRAVISSFNLVKTFIRAFGGIQVSSNEALLIMWSTNNTVAVIDLVYGNWRQFEVEQNDAYRFGFWVLSGNNRLDDMTMNWKAIDYMM